MLLLNTALIQSLLNNLDIAPFPQKARRIISGIYKLLSYCLQIKNFTYHTRCPTYNPYINQAFAAKYRRKVFIAQIINELSTIFVAFCLQFNAGLLSLTVKMTLFIR